MWAMRRKRMYIYIICALQGGGWGVGVWLGFYKSAGKALQIKLNAIRRLRTMIPLPTNEYSDQAGLRLISKLIPSISFKGVAQINNDSPESLQRIIQKRIPYCDSPKNLYSEAILPQSGPSIQIPAVFQLSFQ
jgi:hypothetical protein